MVLLAEQLGAIMQFSLVIIGDEILHGDRLDGHFLFFKNKLAQYGLSLASVQYLPDERDVLVRQLQRSFADGKPTFVTGGIGATPDDHTRQAAALALNVPLVLHEGAKALIDGVTLQRGERLDSPEHLQRLNLGRFPQGADLIPNPYNQIAGFSIQQHYFLPGFPVMAHPMSEWVLQHYYADHFHQHQSEQRTIWIAEQPESKLAPIMERIEQEFVGVRTFSLPSVGSQDATGKRIPPHIEFGIKAEGEACAVLDLAWQVMLQELDKAGIIYQDRFFL